MISTITSGSMEDVFEKREGGDSCKTLEAGTARTLRDITWARVAT